MTRCPDCDAEAPRRASICPSCGGMIDYSAEITHSWPLVIAASIAAGLALLLLFAFLLP